MPRAALIVGIALTAAALVLHLRFHHGAGGLWRDEANSVNVASLPSVAEVASHLQYDSFPPAWIGLVYAWRGAGLGGDDAGYRRLGLAIGITTIGVVWWTGMRLGVGPPLVMLLLLGMSPSMIVYGDMVRGYGLAALAILWSAGALWAFVQHPTRGRWAVAQVAAIAAAQTHFGNGIPLLGIGVGAALVCWRRGQLRLLVATLSIGAVAAAALFALNHRILLYMMQAGQQELHESVSLAWIASVFAHSLAPGAPALEAAWAIAAVAAAAGFAAAAVPAPADDGLAKDVAIFAVTAVAIALGGTLPAYVRASIPTHYWHYLSLIAMSGLACELGTWLLARRFRHGEIGRIAAVGLAAALAYPEVAETVRLRMTTADLAAAEIARSARADDLVVVLPWVAGISFDRYYRGPARWMTLPDLPDHRFHLHLLVRERMERGADGVASELARVEETLRRGGRVWVVGTLVAPEPGRPLAPLPSPQARGSAGRHLDHWELQLGALLEQHAGTGRPVPLDDGGSVNSWERLPLTVVEGWR